jgi:hypothetical protein
LLEVLKATTAASNSKKATIASNSKQQQARKYSKQLHQHQATTSASNCNTNNYIKQLKQATPSSNYNIK